MIAQYFITFVIPLVFSSLVAAFGWFAYEEIGAVISGVISFILSASWSHFAVMTTRVDREPKARKYPRRTATQVRLVTKRA